MYLILASILASALPSAESTAKPAPKCPDPSAGSCWTVRNFSSAIQHISCVDGDKKRIVDTGCLDNTASYAVQLSQESVKASAAFRCQVVDPDGSLDQVTFLSLAQGDDVYIDVMDRQLRVTVKQRVGGTTERTTDTSRLLTPANLTDECRSDERLRPRT